MNNHMEISTDFLTSEISVTDIQIKPTIKPR